MCGLVGELGADSPFPGAQFAKYTDITGADLPGSPAVSPWLNMGAVNFTGYTIIGTQSPSSPALTVTAMNSFAISAASYNATTGYVTFTVAANSGIIVGTEFTVSGVSPSGYNQTYVAVAGTSGTTVVGNPLSGPIGLPQAISNPGAYVSGGSAVDVIMPGAYVPGTSPVGSLIAPYGTYGSTGVGGVGTYALTQNQATLTITASGNGANQLTISGLIGISPQIALGTVITSSSISGGSTTITGFVSGTLGSNGVYTTAGTLPSGSLERFPAGLNRAVFPTRWKCDSWGAPNRRRRGMGPLSVDLRKRVVSAVREEGMSCRAAAQRFGVSFSSAIRWVAALRERGSYAPLPMGGDTRSQRVEAHTDFLLRLHRREPDLTLNEICDRLERARGEKVSPSMIWRFFDRHDITFKKSPRTRVSRAARTSLSGDGDGSTVNSISIR